MLLAVCKSKIILMNMPRRKYQDEENMIGYDLQYLPAADDEQKVF